MCLLVGGEVVGAIGVSGAPTLESDVACASAALALVPADRRATLVARREATSEGLPQFVFDIRLQGDAETVFFEA